MGVYRKELNLKGVIRVGGLYIILTKEKGFGLWGIVNHGKVARKYMKELMEDKGYSSKVCLHRLIFVFTLQL